MIETIGWIIFLIGFLMANVYSTNVPAMEEISRGSVYYLLILLGQAVLTYGVFDWIKAGFEEKALKNKKAKLTEEDKKTAEEIIGKLKINSKIKMVLGMALAFLFLVMGLSKTQWQTWYWVFAGFYVAGIGLGILNKPKPKAADHHKKGVKHKSALEYVKNLRRGLKEIEYQQADPAILKSKLEKLKLQYVVPLVEHRHNYLHDYGVSDFAEFFSMFSSGERYLNRAWSALVDGYTVESENSLKKAEYYFNETEKLLVSLVGGGPEKNNPQPEGDKGPEVEPV